MNKNISIISLTILSIILLFGWVIPDFPYSRRLSREKANELAQELKNLHAKNWASIQNSSFPKLTEEERNRFNKIKLKLIMAGYDANFNIENSTGLISLSLTYPEYAQ